MILELLERRTIECQCSWGMEHKPAWIVGDFGIHQGFHGDDRWRITHLPSGWSFGYAFESAELAAEAAQEISSLRNTWAFITQDEIYAIGKTIVAIQERLGGTQIRGVIRHSPVNNLNGYAEAPTE